MSTHGTTTFSLDKGLKKIYTWIMTDTDLLIKEIRTLPEESVTEVLDFVGYLKQKQSRDTGIGLDDECPLDHTPNAVTIAAIQEGDAMLRGEIPANRYHSFGEMLKALHS
jgi:hypothetical protein